MTDEQLKVFLLKQFMQPLNHILNNPQIRKAGYNTDLSTSSDLGPQGLIARIEKPGVHTGLLNFDLFFARNGKPAAVVANFQGGGKRRMEEFRKAVGKSAFDVLLEGFKKGFPEREQLIALNVRRHAYRRPLNEKYIAAGMKTRGKLTEKETQAFCDLAFYSKKEAAENHGITEAELDRVIEMVKQEKARIPREATGMHKAAFAKAGFNRRSKSRYWRMKKLRNLESINAFLAKFSTRLNNCNI